MTVTIPIKTISLTNSREHWRARSRRVGKEKSAVILCFTGKTLPPLPVVVGFCRKGIQLLDDDNLPSSCKSLRDQVAALYKIDDRDPRIKWEYSQRRVKRAGIGVEVNIVAAV